MIGEKLCFAIAFAAEAMIAWLYLEYILSRKNPLPILICSFSMGYAVLFVFSFLDDTTVNAIMFCVVNFILIKQNYSCSIKTTLLHSAFMCFAMVGAEVLVALWLGIYGYEFSAYTNDFRAMIALAILGKLLYHLLSVIGSRIFAPHKCINEEPKQMILFCGLPLLSSVIAVIIVYIGMNAGFADTVGIMTIIIVVTLLIVNLLFLALYNALQKANEEYLALQLSTQKEQADIAYYSALQEQFENQRILIHDIKKHLGTIHDLAKQNDVAEIEMYISGLEDTFSPSKQVKLCTDPILNLLLLRFRDDCKAKNIQFHCDVRENSPAFLDAASITTLYGNLLSNALESAEASTERQVELSVIWNAIQSVIVISVTNSCDDPPMPDGDGGFRTKKTDWFLHGVGLRSISRIVAKYHGVATMYYDPENKQFHHVIQFPAPT
mgnify:FL=1